MTMADMEKVPGGDLKHCMKMISIIPFLWRCYIELVIVKDHHGHLAAKMQGLAVSPVKALGRYPSYLGRGYRAHSVRPPSESRAFSAWPAISKSVIVSLPPHVVQLVRVAIFSLVRAARIA